MYSQSDHTAGACLAEEASQKRHWVFMINYEQRFPSHLYNLFRIYAVQLWNLYVQRGIDELSAIQKFAVQLVSRCCMGFQI